MKVVVVILALSLTLSGVALQQGDGGIMDRIRGFLGRFGSSEAIEVRTGETSYAVGERVEILIRNSGSKELNGTPSYIIYDSSDREVFSPMFAQMIKTLKPNETISFTWIQKNNEGVQVRGGTYHIKASFAGLTAENVFEIRDEFVNIGKLAEDPQEFGGVEVTLSGKFVGWSIPEQEIIGPMVTRSDWLLEENTGAIYVTHLNPEPLDPQSDFGREVVVRGIARVTDSGVYIEGIMLSVLG